MKVEVEVSDEDAKFLSQTMKIYDVEKLLESMLHEICVAIVEAKAMKKAGIEVSHKDIEAIGMQIAKKALEDGRKTALPRRENE